MNLSECRERVSELETALRELRRFANRMLDTKYAREALRYQDLADLALGYCGCPDCSAAHDAEVREAYTPAQMREYRKAIAP